MRTGDFYPTRRAERISWHANFASQAAATGVADGLSGANVTQAGVDSAAIAAILSHNSDADAYAEGLTEYVRLMLASPLGTATPPIPQPPAPLTLPAGALPSIEARTRLFAGILKAAAGYSAVKGEQYGIVPAAAPAPGVPSISSTETSLGHRVTLRFKKAGYRVLVVESRRGGGNWEQIGVSQTRTFEDARAPLTAGQPEQREYRVRGLLSNKPMGEVSQSVNIVTVP